MNFKGGVNLRRSKSLTDSRKARGAGYPNIFRFESFPIVPRVGLVSDITYLRTGEGFMYYCMVKDVVTGEVLGDHMSERMTSELAVKAMSAVIARHRLEKGCMFPTPKTSQYVFAHAHTGRPWTDANMTYIWRMARMQVINGEGENAHPTQLRIHDLHHAYAIKLAEAGCPMHFISEVLGHHSIDFTRKYYVKFSPESATNTVMQYLNDIGVKNTHQYDTTKIQRAA